MVLADVIVVVLTIDILDIMVLMVLVHGEGIWMISL